VSIYYDLILDEKSPELEKGKEWNMSPKSDEIAKPGAQVLVGL
jgi:hypothetical protein